MFLSISLNNIETLYAFYTQMLHDYFWGFEFQLFAHSRELYFDKKTWADNVSLADRIWLDRVLLTLSDKKCYVAP